MNLSFVFNRIKNLIINPRIEWTQISEENITRRQMIRGYALPLILLVGICSISGDMIAMSREWFKASFVIIKALGIIGVGYGGLVISAQIIHELAPSFHSRKDINLTYKIVVNSLLVYYLVMAVVSLVPFLQTLWVFQFFSAYLFWMGSSPVLKTPDDNKAGFVVVASLITSGIFLILNKILEQILLGIFGIGMIM